MIVIVKSTRTKLNGKYIIQNSTESHELVVDHGISLQDTCNLPCDIDIRLVFDVDDGFVP